MKKILAALCLTFALIGPAEAVDLQYTQVGMSTDGYIKSYVDTAGDGKPFTNKNGLTIFMFAFATTHAGNGNPLGYVSYLTAFVNCERQMAKTIQNSVIEHEGATQIYKSYTLEEIDAIDFMQIKPGSVFSNVVDFACNFKDVQSSSIVI